MIASLPMYDRPSNAAAHNRFWALVREGLRDRGIAAPDTLDRNTIYRDSWSRPDLVLGQICVLPYRKSFANSVTLIGAADHRVEDCPPGYYRSLVVARKDDRRTKPSQFATARFAANSMDSHSGFAAAEWFAREDGWALPAPILTGSHDESLRAVVSGKADFAALDAQTWRLQKADMTEPDGVKIIAVTRSDVGQSFITRKGVDPAPYFDAIAGAIKALAPADREVLHLYGIVQLPASAYDDPQASIAIG